MKENGAPLFQRPAVPTPRFGLEEISYGDEAEPFNNQANLPITPINVVSLKINPQILPNHEIEELLNLDISNGRRDLA